MSVRPASALPGIALVAALAGCSATPPPTTPSEAASPVPAATAETVEPAPTAAAGSICDLITLGEAAVVLGSATIATDFSFGDLASDFGGQCVWSTDPEGDIETDDVRVLELIAYLPGSMNPPPAEAPAVGSGATVASETGVFFTDDTHVFWIRVTAAASQDPVAITAARDLAPVVLSRL